jgi:ABC-type multidrug transport system ATPase subunit
MRQKILISAALLHNPTIVILDEPNSGLDVTTTFVLRSLVQTLASEGRMVVYSSHVLESVERVATDVIILNDGRVAAHDSVSRLRELMELASLEQVFRQLVIETDIDGMASDLVAVMKLDSHACSPHGLRQVLRERPAPRHRRHWSSLVWFSPASLIFPPNTTASLSDSSLSDYTRAQVWPSSR